MTQKLESIQKILLATGTINYLACAVSSVNEQSKMIPGNNSVHLDGIQERDQLLSATVISITEIMETLADYMNNSDCISPIDIIATEAAFNILVNGQDDVDGPDQDEEISAVEPKKASTYPDDPPFIMDYQTSSGC